MMTQQAFAEALRDIALRRLCPILSFEKRRDLATWPIKIELFPKTLHLYGETRTDDRLVCIYAGNLTYRQEFAYDVLHELCHVPQGPVFVSMYDVMFGTNLGHSGIWVEYMNTLGLKPIASGQITKIAMNNDNWHSELLAQVNALGPVEGLL